MSKVLVVHGYYDEAGEYGKVLDAIKDGLQANQIKPQNIDVINPFTFCRQQFNQNESNNPKDTASWYRGMRTPFYQNLIKEHQAKILDADLIVFYFPIWWEAQPPLMAQWVSDVFRADSFKTIDGKPVAQWGDKHQAMIITTSGYADEVKKDNFSHMLEAQGLSSIADKLSANELIKIMNMAEGYQLSTALTYAGMPITTQTHVNNVQSGSDAHLLLAIKDGIREFVEKATLKPEPKQETLLLSGGPGPGSQPKTEIPQLHNPSSNNIRSQKLN